MSGRLLLRHATSRDSPEMILAARVDRRLVIVLDREEIVAAAAVFEHLDGGYFEAGAARETGSPIFRLPRKSLVEHAQQLLAVEQKALTQRESGDVLHLDLGLESLSYHRDAVESLAGGNLACLGEHLQGRPGST